MTLSSDGDWTALAHCHGYAVVASDGLLGKVETPLFPPDGGVPDYLIVRTAGLLGRRPVVATALVERVDPERRLIYVRPSGAEIASLPEHLPLAIY